MLYYNNRPVNPTRRHPSTERFFQWRTFKPDTEELRAKIESDFGFEVRSLVNDNEPLELWERSISTNFPLKRTTSATIGSAIPRFRGSLNSVMTPDSLSESLQRKSKYFETTKSRQVFTVSRCKARIKKRFYRLLSLLALSPLIMSILRIT